MSNEANAELIHRIKKLGIPCEHAPATHCVDPSIAAVACFPMHMVASASVLMESPDEDRRNKRDLFNIAGVREAFVIGEQESSLAVFNQHIKSLHSMLEYRRAADIIIYEYALQTLRVYFSIATPDVVELLKLAIARSVVAVSTAAGEGWFGQGSEPSDEQRTCIDTICDELELLTSPTAKVEMNELSSSV